MSKIHVIGLQILCNAKKEDMLKKAEELVEQAACNQKKIDLIAAPEMYYQHFGGKDYGEPFGEEPHGRFEEFWREIAKKYHTNVITGSYALLEPGNETGINSEISGTNKTKSKKVKNRVLVMDRNGLLVGHYDKLHLFDAYGVRESDWSDAGTTLGLFDLDIGKVGTMICYDLRFPEEARALALRGADFLVTPAAFFQPRFDHWELLVRSISVVNLLPVLAINQSGRIPGLPQGYVGRSMLTDAEGRIRVQASDGEGYIVGEIDTAFTRQVRETNPALQNMRTELYKEWIQ